MLVHHYSKDTFAFLYSAEGIESPLEPGVTLVPARATIIAPPSVIENEVAIFNTIDSTWSIQPTFVGQTAYEKSNGLDLIIRNIGDVPTNVTLLKPATESDVWNETLLQWETSLVKLKLSYKLEIDEMSETIRLRHLTAGAGQIITYQEKADEAGDYVAAGYPVGLSGYPFIQAEVNATNKTATQAADDILTQQSAWIIVGAQIEELRIGGKFNIDNATVISDVEVIKDNTIVALDLL